MKTTRKKRPKAPSGLVATGKIVKITVCVTAEQLAMLEEWRRRRGLTRGAAMRTVLEQWRYSPTGAGEKR